MNIHDIYKNTTMYLESLNKILKLKLLLKLLSNSYLIILKRQNKHVKKAKTTKNQYTYYLVIFL